jgi:hypothetical protein
MTQNETLDDAISCLVNCGANFVDALDQDLQAEAASVIIQIVRWAERMAKRCQPDPCPID